jgi:type IV fimbrial biogenesis protein FimT
MRLKTATELFIAHLNLARSEAIKRNARVVLCKSGDGQQCASEGAWEQGWIVFHDANGNARVDEEEALLLQQAALHASVRFSGNSNIARYVSYTPDGGANLVSGAFQAGTFTLCTQSDAPLEGRQIVISKAGQPRVAKVKLAVCH